MVWKPIDHINILSGCWRYAVHHLLLALWIINSSPLMWNPTIAASLSHVALIVPHFLSIHLHCLTYCASRTFLVVGFSNHWLEKHGIHGVHTSTKRPRRHLSVFAKLQTMWMVRASYIRHRNIIYIFRARRHGGVLSISLISMEILFGTISHTSLSVSTAKPPDIERDDCSSSNHSWSVGQIHSAQFHNQ